MQMVQQLIVMREQLTEARNQLTQAQRQYESMTGRRGMEQAAGGDIPQLPAARLGGTRSGIARARNRAYAALVVPNGRRHAQAMRY
jgi:outer membrane protein TolC